MALNERQRQRQRARNRIYKQKRKARREAALLSRNGPPRDPRLRSHESQRPPETAPAGQSGGTGGVSQTPPKSTKAPASAWDATPDRDTFDKLIEDITRLIKNSSERHQPTATGVPATAPSTSSSSASSSASSSPPASPSSSSSSSPASTSGAPSDDPLDSAPSEDGAVEGGAANGELRHAITFKRPERSGSGTTDPTVRRPTDPAKWDPLWRPACAHAPQTRPRPPLSRSVDLKRLDEVRRNLLESIDQKPPPRVIGHHTTNDDPSRKRKRQPPPKIKGGKRPRKR